MATRTLPLMGGHPPGPAATLRTDSWWVGPLLTFCGFSAFIVYATWAAFQGEHYYYGPYLSPFYSPVLFSDPLRVGSAPLWHAWFGAWPEWWPALLPASAAFLILPFPGLFRFTCYYYRKAYYRAFAGSPPACAVSALATGKRYEGETRLLLFQNLHRYALYFAILFLVFLYYDAFLALKRDGEWGVGIGSIVLLTNATLLAGYAFGCHSFRHLIGGRDDCLSCEGRKTVRFSLWKKSSWLNSRHMLFAWLSLFWVAFSDVYVRLLSMGVIRDLNTWDM